MLNLQRGFDAKDITAFFGCHRSVCLLVFLSIKSSNVLAKGMLILLIGYGCEDHGFLILDFNRSACSSVFVLLCSERAMYSRTKRSKELLKA
jgi:hypothetical protein